MFKNRPACRIWPFLKNIGTKLWRTLARKRKSNIANKVLEKKQWRGSLPNCKTKALAFGKFKGKENCENAYREKANFAQKTNATEQLWWYFISISQLNLFTWFSPIDSFEIAKGQKVILAKVQFLALMWCLKTSRAWFFSSQIPFAEKGRLWQARFSLDFGAFFAYPEISPFRYLVQLFQNCAKHKKKLNLSFEWFFRFLLGHVNLLALPQHQHTSFFFFKENSCAGAEGELKDKF